MRNTRYIRRARESMLPMNQEQLKSLIFWKRYKSKCCHLNLNNEELTLAKETFEQGCAKLRWLFAGVTSFGKDAKKPRGEFWRFVLLPICGRFCAGNAHRISFFAALHQIPLYSVIRKRIRRCNILYFCSFSTYLFVSTAKNHKRSFSFFSSSRDVDKKADFTKNIIPMGKYAFLTTSFRLFFFFPPDSSVQNSLFNTNGADTKNAIYEIRCASRDLACA